MRVGSCVTTNVRLLTNAGVRRGLPKPTTRGSAVAELGNEASASIGSSPPRLAVFVNVTSSRPTRSPAFWSSPFTFVVNRIRCKILARRLHQEHIDELLYNQRLQGPDSHVGNPPRGR